MQWSTCQGDREGGARVASLHSPAATGPLKEAPCPGAAAWPSSGKVLCTCLWRSPQAFVERKQISPLYTLKHCCIQQALRESWLDELTKMGRSDGWDHEGTLVHTRTLWSGRRWRQASLDSLGRCSPRWQPDGLGDPVALWVRGPPSSWPREHQITGGCRGWAEPACAGCRGAASLCASCRDQGQLQRLPPRGAPGRAWRQGRRERPGETRPPRLPSTAQRPGEAGTPANARTTRWHCRACGCSPGALLSWMKRDQMER